jgi:putative nucleotidyltransferase with HDIG domain
MVALISKAAADVGHSIDEARRLQHEAQSALAAAHRELINTYDMTLEGWARALDLRDQVTHDHCQRVIDLTLRLAREMGVTEDEMVHIRRGALLHDIGKMGLPDRVLLKPDVLTSEEQALMQLHPVYAKALLGPIEYLEKALDIPYAHHERWDGSGYPQGLKGEAIPLAARIFAVADIWDALISARPYKAAWPEGQARDYIRSLAGTKLDPSVVDAFFRLNARDTAAACESTTASENAHSANPKHKPEVVETRRS